MDVIGGRRQLRNEPDRASPRRSRRCWKGSCRAMPRWETSSRDASRPAPSAPTSPTPISRLRGNSRRRYGHRAIDQQPTSSGDPAPARADPPQAPPVVLEVSPFSLAERTAFVGRETEGSAIRAVIDRARAGHGSVVMLWDGPGVGKTRLAMEMAEYASRSRLPMLRRALLRKRRTFSLSPVRRDHRK